MEVSNIEKVDNVSFKTTGMANPSISESVNLIVDSQLNGFTSHSLVHVKKIPAISCLFLLVEELVKLKNSEEIAHQVSRISRLLSLNAEFAFLLSSESGLQKAANEQFVNFDNLKPAEIANSGISISVTGEERTQLRYDFSNNSKDSIFVHYLMSATFGGGEIFCAIRWLHGSEEEEVVIRFRQNSIIVGKSIEIVLPTSNVLNLISVGRSAGRDIILLNGFPVFVRVSTTSTPTGITLDVIGTAGNNHAIDIPLFLVAEDEIPEFGKNMVFSEWFELLIRHFSNKSDLEKLAHLVYSFGGLDDPLSIETYELALDANLKEMKAYRDFLTDNLIELLHVDCRDNALRQLVDKEPPSIIQVENVSLNISSNPSLNSSFKRLIGRGGDKVTLLDKINFRAYGGDIIGILGKNGAGKSTFLKTLVAAMPITSGIIGADGRPVLLRPGAGMQGDLTGRENIIKTGLYLGLLPNEMQNLIDEIIEFSELGEHIDRPFRYYSDGMRARLVFSLATAVPRDILLLDELLSAGDMGFQRKAMKRLDEFIASAKLVFVVQHTFDFVLSRCTKCLLLDKGRPVYFGDPKIATEIYKESL